MILKTKICSNCSSSFVEEAKNQELCNECVLLEELETDQEEKPKYDKLKLINKINGVK